MRSELQTFSWCMYVKILDDLDALEKGIEHNVNKRYYDYRLK